MIVIFIKSPSQKKLQTRRDNDEIWSLIKQKQRLLPQHYFESQKSIVNNGHLVNKIIKKL